MWLLLFIYFHTSCLVKIIKVFILSLKINYSIISIAYKTLHHIVITYILLLTTDYFLTGHRVKKNLHIFSRKYLVVRKTINWKL